MNWTQYADQEVARNLILSPYDWKAQLYFYGTVYWEGILKI